MAPAPLFFYANRTGEQRGPVSLDVLDDLVAHDVVSHDVLVWSPDIKTTGWIPLAQARKAPVKAKVEEGGAAGGGGLEGGGDAPSGGGAGAAPPPRKASLLETVVGGGRSRTAGLSRLHEREQQHLGQVDKARRALGRLDVSTAPKAGSLHGGYGGMPPPMPTPDNGIINFARVPAPAPAVPDRRAPPGPERQGSRRAGRDPRRSVIARCGACMREILPSIHRLRALPMLARNVTVGASLLVIWGAWISLAGYGCLHEGGVAFGGGVLVLLIEYMLALEYGPRTKKDAKRIFELAGVRDARPVAVRAPWPWAWLGYARWGLVQDLSEEDQPMLSLEANQASLSGWARRSLTPPSTRPSAAGAAERGASTPPSARPSCTATLSAAAAADDSLSTATSNHTHPRLARAALACTRPPPTITAKGSVRSVWQWPVKAVVSTFIAYWLQLERCAVPLRFGAAFAALAVMMQLLAALAAKPDVRLWAITSPGHETGSGRVARAAAAAIQRKEMQARRAALKASRGGRGVSGQATAGAAAGAAAAGASADVDGDEEALPRIPWYRRVRGWCSCLLCYACCWNLVCESADLRALPAAILFAVSRWYSRQVRKDEARVRIWQGIYLGASVALFAEAAHRHAASPKALTNWYPAAKGFGQLLNLNCMLLILPVVRSAAASVQGASARLPNWAGAFITRVLPLDLGIKAHIGIAKYGVCLATLGHATCHYANYALADIYFRAGLWHSGDAEVMAYGWQAFYGLTGHVLMGILIFICASAAEAVRRAQYETFWLSHHLFLLFFFVLLFHGPVFWKWVVGPLALYLLERIYRLAFRGRRLVALRSVHWYYADELGAVGTIASQSQAAARQLVAAAEAQKAGLATTEGGGGLLSRITGGSDDRAIEEARLLARERDLARMHRTPAVFTVRFDNRRGLGGNKQRAALEYLEGQYLYLSCPHVSGWEWHPFTIASAPSDDFLEINIRVIQDRSSWTYRVCAYLLLLNPERRTDLILKTRANSSTGHLEEGKVHGPDGRPLFRIDGPYGAPSQNFLSYRSVMCVGAGIGVTPLASILQGTVMHRWMLGFQPYHIHFAWVAKRGDVSAFKWLLLRLPELKARALAHNEVYAKEESVESLRAKAAEKRGERQRLLNADAPAEAGDAEAGAAGGWWPDRRSRASGNSAARAAELEREAQELEKEAVAVLDSSRVLDISIFLTGTTEEQLRPPGRGAKAGEVAEVLAELQAIKDDRTGEPFVRVVAGRPNWRAEFARAKSRFAGRPIGVIFCGAEAIATQLKTACIDMSDTKDGTFFRLHKENF